MRKRLKVEKSQKSKNRQNLAKYSLCRGIGASLDGFQLYGVPGAGRTLTASIDYDF